MSEISGADSQSLESSFISLLAVFETLPTLLTPVEVFLARGSIFRQKTEYDKRDWASKKNRDYEKYHSDWMSDEVNFERDGKKKLTDEEFRKSL